MIYFCIPCHNEERTVGIVLWKIRQVMAEFPRDYQILVADDASTDKSYDVLEPYSRVLPLTLLRQTQKRGYAATLEMLLREAVRRSAYPKRDIIVIMQADFTDDPEFAVSLLKRMESGADVAVPDPVVAKEPGFVRGLANRFARQLARRRTWPPEVKDPLHGFVAVRLICAQKAFEAEKGRLLAWEGRAANAAFLHAALPFARRVDSVEITVHPDRLQRNSRFAAMAAIESAWRFGRGARRAGLLGVEQLAPDQVHGDRAALRTSSPNGREEPEPRQSGPRRKQDGTPDRSRRSRSGEDRIGSRDSRQGGRSRRAEESRPPARVAADPAEPGETTESQPGRRSRGGRSGGRRPEQRPDHASEMSPQGDDAEAMATAETGSDSGNGDGAEPRKRRSRGTRGRRGGRKRTARSHAGTEPGETAQDSNSEGLTDTTGSAEDSPSDASEANAEGGSTGPRKRRRRGRRGGRRHRSSRSAGDGTVGAPEGGGAAGSPGGDPAPAGAGKTGPSDE